VIDRRNEVIRRVAAPSRAGPLHPPEPAARRASLRGPPNCRLWQTWPAASWLRALPRARAARARTCSAANRVEAGHAAKPGVSRHVHRGRASAALRHRAPPGAARFVIIMGVMSMSGTLHPRCARRVPTHRAQLPTRERGQSVCSSLMGETALQQTRRRAATSQA